MNDGESYPYNVLFLCSGNSARSIMAEAILNRAGAPKFKAYSAGSRPKGEVNRYVIAFLKRRGFETDELRPKSWLEFAVPGAPKLDFVFAVCDNAESEVCLAWPGQPVTAHWDVPDLMIAGGSEAAIAQAFSDVYRQLEDRITDFCMMPFTSFDWPSLKRKIDDISKMSASAR